MSYRKQAMKYGSAVVVTVLTLVNGAIAAVPANVTTAITTAEADVATIGGAILGVVVVIAGFMWLRKPIH